MFDKTKILDKTKRVMNDLGIVVLDIKEPDDVTGSFILMSKAEDETLLNVVINDLEEKKFLSLFLPVEFDDLATKDKEMISIIYKSANMFNFLCRSIKCFIVDDERGRVIFSSETFFNLEFSENEIKDWLSYSMKSIKEVMPEFKKIIREKKYE